MQRFIQDSSGTTVIEYALIAGVFGMALIVGYKLMGNSMMVVYNQIDERLDKSEQIKE